MGQRDNERVSFLRRDDMADDATFVAGIRHLGDDVAQLVCDADIFGSEVFGQRWRQFYFEWQEPL